MDSMLKTVASGRWPVARFTDHWPLATDHFLLHFPPWLGEIFTNDLFRGLALWRVAAILFSAGNGWPFPDAESTEPRVSPPDFKEGFVQLRLEIHIHLHLFLGVVPRLVGDVFLAEPA